MFTGIVEILGSVLALEELDTTESGGGGTSATIGDAAEILHDVHLGDSISVNGTCLTVTWFDATTFKIGIAPETLRRTNLGSLKKGDKVNLERAMLATTRMGGHVVQGHVDTIATILAKTPDGNAVTYRLQPREREWLKYVVEKGFICLDGASLTVTKVDDEESWWEVMLIAYTQTRVVMGSKNVGDHVNVEVDMIGKYVEKSVQAYLQDHGKENGGFVGNIVDKFTSTKSST